MNCILLAIIEDNIYLKAITDRDLTFQKKRKAKTNKSIKNNIVFTILSFLLRKKFTIPKYHKRINPSLLDYLHQNFVA